MANRKYDQSVDMWSLGICILQLLLLLPQNKVPDVRVQLLKDPDHVKRLLNGKNQKLASICVSCLKLDPVERPTAKEIMTFIDDEKATNLEHNEKVSVESVKQEGVNPLLIIRGKKAQDFWKNAGWGEKVEIEYEEFKEEYFKLLDYKKMNKDQERGFRKLLQYEGLDGKKKTNCFKFTVAIQKAGFPFSAAILATVEKYSAMQEGINSESKTDYTKPMDKEAFKKAKAEYLQMIADCDRIFVDPISQEVLNVDQHCAPLKLATDEEWGEMMQGSYDMDLEDDKLMKLERLGMATTQKPQYDNAIEYLVNTQSKRFIILGPAAAGKTCLMRLLMFKAGLKALSKEDESLVPMFVPVAALSNFEKDMDYKLKCIRGCAVNLLKKEARFPDAIEHMLWQCIVDNKAMILLDGLDEAATNEDKIDNQKQIIALPQKNSIIVTSRVSGFETTEDGRPLFDSYNLAKIQPLSIEIQKQIAEKRGVTSEEFTKALEGKYHELAKTPLLLSLLINEFKETKTLPEVRASLYGQAVNTMLNVFFNKNFPKMDQKESDQKKEDIKVFLLKLSVKLHGLKVRDIDAESIENDTDEHIKTQWKYLQTFIDAGKFSLIILLNGKYRFSHLSFQEYFIAKTWANNKIESDIRLYEKKLFGGKQLNFGNKLKNFVIDPWYRETFLLCAGAMEKDDFMNFGKYLLNLYSSQGGLIDSIIYNMIKERPEGERKDYIKLLTTLNSEKKLIKLMEGLIHPSNDMREIAISRIKLYKKEKKLDQFLLKHLGDEEKYAAEAMSVVIPKGDAESIKILLDELTTNKSELVRERVCMILGNVTENGNELVRNALLKQYDVDIKNSDIIKEIIISLGKIAKNGDQNVIEKLLDLTKDYKLRDVCATALGIVSPKGDKLIIKKLTELASLSEEACISLGKVGHPGDREITKTLLKALDSNTFDEIKISHALAAISKGNNDEFVYKELLNNISTGKRRLATRCAACLGQVVEKSDKQVIQELFTLCDNTSSSNRALAAVALGFCAKKGSKKVVAKLLDLISDKTAHHAVRVAAAESLSKIARKGDRNVVKTLIHHLGETEEVVIAVSSTLIDIAEKGNSELIKEFIELLKHPDPGVVQKVVEVLGKLGTPGDQTVIKCLLEKLDGDTSTELIRAVSAQSLGYVATEKDDIVLKSLNLILVNPNPNITPLIKQNCVLALGNILKKPTQIPDSFFHLLIGEKDIQHEIIDTIAKLCDITKVIEMFKSKTQHQPVYFSVIIRAIRMLREKDPNYQLPEKSVSILNKITSLEAVFILVENAS